MSVTVSIVIPLYQKETTIRRTIESAQRQTISSFEILVVDDGSTDHGPEVVRVLAQTDRRIRLVSRRNGGPGAAKNTGLREASGALITFLDADDEWQPFFLEHAVQSLEANPKCDVYASAFRISPSGVDRWDELRNHNVKEGAWRLHAGITDHELALSLAVIHSCSSLFRTAVVRHFGGFYERNGCRFGEDIYLWVQLMLHCSIWRSFEVSAWYHSESSELGLTSGRRDIPLEPVLSDTDPIRMNCPAELEGVLVRWIELHALNAVQMYAGLGNIEQVRYLLHAFPQLRRHRRQVLSASLKLRAPRMHQFLRYVIHSISPHSE